jgi:hypothetical protein
MSAHTRRGVYAYGLVRSGPVDLTGLAGVADAADVHLLTRDELSLVVSDVSLAALDLPEEELSENGQLARFAVAHDEVVRRLFEQTTVLPLRLATVVADEEAAAQVLADSAPRALARLAALEGHQEWAVRLRRRGDDGGQPANGRATNGSPASRSAAHGSATNGSATNGSATNGSATHGSATHGSVADTSSVNATARPSGRAYLQRRRDELRAAQEARYREHVLLDDAHDALAAHASESTRRSEGHGEVILTAAYLVPAQAEDAFLAAADTQASVLATAGVTLEVIGPWPPYSFAALDAEEKTHA